jgi:hypothetical protein
MTIPSIFDAGRFSPPIAAAPIDADSVCRRGSTPQSVIDEAARLALLGRFPWMKRFSEREDAADTDRAEFDPAPTVGDHVDRLA